jgi:hypothetical protein
MNDLSEKTSSFVRDLGEAARQNPLSAALIGMGVLWLFTGDRMERARDIAGRSGLDRIPDVASDAVDAARSTFRSGSDAIGERFAAAKDTLQESSTGAVDRISRVSQEYADTASDYVSSMPGAGMEMFDTVRSNLSEVFSAQPLALGAIGLAIGAGIAAALPASEIEAEYLGETSDALRAKATEFATEQTARVTSAAEGVMNAVTEEARKQGLTLEDAKAAAGEISAKVGRVVETAQKGVSGGVHRS